jgi:hypothetical protein
MESGGIISGTPKMPPIILKDFGNGIYEIYGEHGRELVIKVDKEKDNGIRLSDTTR